MTIFRYIYLCAVLNLLLSIALNEAITPTAVEDEKNVNFKIDDNYAIITINENLPFALLFYIEDYTGSINVRDPFECSAVTYHFIDHNGKKAFNLTSALDYEDPHCQIISNAIEDSNTDYFNFDLHINNLDDNPPVLSLPESCHFDENTDYNVDDSPCTIKMTDRDGMMENTEFFITPDHNNDIFKVSFLKTPTHDMKEADVKIFLAPGKQLDFEKTNQYFFTVRAKETVTEGTVQVTVLVTDMPDTPPIFKEIFATQTFEENVDQTFTVIAYDGDIGVNDSIKYEIKDITCESGNCTCKINIGEDDGIITVTNVDREVVGNTITFIITASEVDYDNSTDTGTLYFFIQDQDDNNPKLKLEEKIIEKDENYNGLITNFQAEDMDLGINGTYTVQMDCSNYEVNYCEAFQIIPSQGFQKADFSLSVKNSTKLDYDNQEENWKNITLDIVAIEKGNNSHYDIQTVKITLRDLNDEPPIFTNKTESINIPENIKEGEEIFNASATDRDAGTVITYSINGIWSENLKIDNTGDITTTKDHVFDYETLQQVFIEISASDNDSVHTTYKTLTINVTDIDDEPPTIKLKITDGEDRITIPEEQEAGTLLPLEINATDPDTKPKLELKIDWSTSYVTKNSLIVKDLKDDDWMCFDLFVKEHKELARQITGVLKISNRCSPDFEKFHAIVIFLQVTDKNTEEGIDYYRTSIEIDISDINDNEPIFDNRTFEGLVVTDATTGPIKIGHIIANDDDISDHVIYSIEPLDNNYNWVDIDEDTGDLTIKQDVTINDDIPPKTILSSTYLHLMVYIQHYKS
ncbi:hypothetical protein WA026_007371 [Henosepilachna vigintioctopunctata]|uniref:Cadherin domain-containing protein n=1 Tax=Henosepilachna vigintioctopunctata TaxID=420089 RepID=A0AAW1UUK1_9CUCU